MNWFTKTWKWLDNKKTAIGSLALIAADAISDPTTTAILKGIGILFGAAGIAHKVYKRDLGDGLPSGLTKAFKRNKS